MGWTEAWWYFRHCDFVRHALGRRYCSPCRLDSIFEIYVFSRCAASFPPAKITILAYLLSLSARATSSAAISRNLAPDMHRTSVSFNLFSSMLRIKLLPITSVVLLIEGALVTFCSWCSNSALRARRVSFSFSSRDSLFSSCDFSKFSTSHWFFWVSIMVFICSINVCKTSFVCLTSRAKCLHSEHGQTPISSGGSATHTKWYHFEQRQHLTISRLTAFSRYGHCAVQWCSSDMSLARSAMAPPSIVLAAWRGFIPVSWSDGGSFSTAGASFIPLTSSGTACSLSFSLCLFSSRRALSLFSSHMSHMTRSFSRRLTECFEILHWSQRHFSLDILILVIRELMVYTLTGLWNRRIHQWNTLGLFYQDRLT